MRGLILLSLSCLFLYSSTSYGNEQKNYSFDKQIANHAIDAYTKGRQSFRHDTYGNESFWGDTLKLHLAIAGSNHQGIGPGVSPATALAVGLKVDIDALPQAVIQALTNGNIDLNDPAVTLTLLQLDAVVGLKGRFNDKDQLQSLGITCALCHTDVDNRFSAGIGQRLDGWANRDLNVGLIISLAPDLSALTGLLGVDANTVKTVLQSWGPGKFDAMLLMDGKAFRPDGKSAATLIPPAFGLAGVNLHTWTGWGSITHWNAFVSVLEMGGKGTFYDPRLNDPEKFPIAAANGFGNVRPDEDYITAKLADLQFYQLAIPAPKPFRYNYNHWAAKRGEKLFAAKGKAQCGRCHVPPLYTEPGWNLHSAEEIGIDDFQAKRGPENAYRTAPLKGLWSHQKGGFYHDGRFTSLMDVIEHYNTFFNLGLSQWEKRDLNEFLKSL